MSGVPARLKSMPEFSPKCCDLATYKLTPEQLDAWRKAAAPSEAQWAESVKKVGEDPKAIMDALKASLVKYKSAL